MTRNPYSPRKTQGHLKPRYQWQQVGEEGDAPSAQNMAKTIISVLVRRGEKFSRNGVGVNIIAQLPRRGAMPMSVNMAQTILVKWARRVVMQRSRARILIFI